MPVSRPAASQPGHGRRGVAVGVGNMAWVLSGAVLRCGIRLRPGREKKESHAIDTVHRKKDAVSCSCEQQRAPLFFWPVPLLFCRRGGAFLAGRVWSVHSVRVTLHDTMYIHVYMCIYLFNFSLVLHFNCIFALRILAGRARESHSRGSLRI